MQCKSDVVMNSWLPLKFGKSRIQCLIHSDTESARVRKIKEIWTAEWAAGLPRDAVFYDVGANIGIMSLLAARTRVRMSWQSQSNRP